MATRIQLRRDTAANWTSVNPTLAQGEIGIETDTNNLKLGDGVKNWQTLPYYTPMEADPIFTAWLAATPPAYPGDIPTDLSELSDNTGVIPTDLSQLADSIGVIPTAISELSNDSDFTTLATVKADTDIASAITNDHTHTNKTSLDKIGESSGDPTWNGSAWPGGGGGGAGVTDITYADLVAAIGASGLIVGGLYKIVDFATKHYIIDDDDVWLDGSSNPEIHTGVTEPLIVRALDVNVISHEAKSEMYPHDVIHYDWNPANWIFDIAFANYDEEVLTGFKGVIYWRHYLLNDVSAPGDWRNVMCRRWAVPAYDAAAFQNEYIGIGSTAAGVTDPADYVDVRMFEETVLDPLDDRVMGLTIAPFRDRQNLYYLVPTILPNTVFQVLVDEGWWQIIGIRIHEMCYNNTFGGYIDVCQIGSGFFKNTIGGSFQSNTIGRGFRNNTIGSGFSSNTIGSGFSFNTIGSVFSGNIIGSNYSNNNIGSQFFANNISNNFQRNTIGNFFYYNTVQNNVQYLITPDKTGSNDQFRHNLIRDGVQGGSGTELDFTSATHVFLNYNCELYRRLDGTVRLKYMDNSDELVVANYNA